MECEYQSCTTQANYGEKGTTRARFCAKHRSETMVYVAGRTCQGQDCYKQPSFGDEGCKITHGTVCLTHATEGMVNLRIPRKCQKENCESKRRVSKSAKGRLALAKICPAHAHEGVVETKSPVCAREGCSKNPWYVRDGTLNPAFCREHKEEDMISLHSSNKCKHSECALHASWAPEGTKKPLYCTAHKKEGMINISSRKKRCETAGCELQAKYGMFGSKVKSCLTHKAPGMIDLTCKKCRTKGCGTQPSYGDQGGKAVVCFTHATVGMVPNRGRASQCKNPACSAYPSLVETRKGIKLPKYCPAHILEEGAQQKPRQYTCKDGGCSMTASYGPEGTRTRVFCATHKQQGMVIFCHQECSQERCDREAWYGVEGTKKREFCKAHKKDGMISQKTPRRCSVSKCDKVPSYGLTGDKSPRFCVRHKTAEMIYNKNKPCKQEGCPRQRSFGAENSGCALFCSAHASQGMVDVVTKKCGDKKCNKHPSFGRIEDGRVARVYCAKHQEAECSAFIDGVEWGRRRGPHGLSAATRRLPLWMRYKRATIGWSRT